MVVENENKAAFRLLKFNITKLPWPFEENAISNRM